MCVCASCCVQNYEIEVKEAKPKNAISVVETDCQVDFEAPKDYIEPVYTRNVPVAPSPGVLLLYR